MSGRRKDEDNFDDITAQPIGAPEELGRRGPTHEVGLSVDADELGRNFLSDATEQGNFESQYDDSDELSEGPRSDDALTGPNFEATNDVWENTVNLTLQGSADDEPLVDERADGLRFIEDDDEATSSDDVDLTDNTVQEASLLDREGDEAGETESPEVRTDDINTRKKPRGGHTPKSKSVHNQR
ncbi:MAG TPA: hypothetical protein VFX59_28965 [Polyangiales bacterium]|nr:hypothetical protein [Polyangiales bacterium]